MNLKTFHSCPSLQTVIVAHPNPFQRVPVGHSHFFFSKLKIFPPSQLKQIFPFQFKPVGHSH